MVNPTRTIAAPAALALARRWWPRLLNQWVVIGTGFTLMVIILVVLIVLRPTSPVVKLQKQANIVLFYPNSGDGWQLKPNSANYDTTHKVAFLTYASHNTTLIITEQATPDPINDVPDYYSKMIEKLNGYQTIGTSLGNVSLTRPRELGGSQSAVLNTQGTLMFVRPNHDLSADDWRRLVNNFRSQK